MAFKIIYEPKGRAKEYGDLALNIYTGCSFGCKYCYAPNVLKKDRDTFHQLSQARENIINKVIHDCEHNQFEGRRVHLCFTCDPYQDIDKEMKLTREILWIFARYGVNFQILTKGGTLAIRDFDLYKPGDSFGSTLTFRKENESREWEPGAALPEDRFEAIRQAKAAGIKTWVSLEPVIKPSDALDIVHIMHPYVDLWKVGKWNYDSRAAMVNWQQFREAIELVMNMHGCEYYLKDDLKNA